jgi:hypothetical protein
MYMQLTEAEASFRALKSELSIRPLFHQRESRVKAHVPVAFPGYALWVTLKHLLQRRPAMVPQLSASGVVNIQLLSPMKARALLSADLPNPRPNRNPCWHQLGLSLPERLKSLSKCSADFATA